MTRDEALEKIKKCLALASSPEPHEAAAALRQAQKLMQQFGLSETDVTLAEVSERSQKSHNIPLVNWEALLVDLVAKTFGCDYYTRVLSKGLSSRRERHFVFVGIGAAPEVAGYAFDVLLRQCTKDRRAYMGKQSKNCKAKTKVARGDLFAEGWIHGVRAKLDAFVSGQREIELLAQYMRARHSAMGTAKVKNRTTGKNITHNDFHHGSLAGRKADLNHGLAVHAPQSLIAGATYA